jgi:hypothetical protein
MKWAMPQYDPTLKSNISVFLDYPEVENEKSKVFIRFHPTPVLKDVDAALRYLQTESPIPFLLRKPDKKKAACVEVEALGTPTKMFFGFSSSTDNPCDDHIAIINWFGMNK